MTHTDNWQNVCQGVTEDELRQIFEKIDRDGDGHINKHELIIALRKNKDICELLGLPSKIRQEDGSRDILETFFQLLDQDGSRTLEWEEFVELTRQRREDKVENALELENSCPPPAPTSAEAYLTMETHGTGLISTDVFTKYPQLQTIDISSNCVEDMKSLGKIPYLTSLNACKNRLKEALDIHPATPCLRYANLSANFIKSIRDLTPFKSLQTLILDHNDVSSITGLEKLCTLRVLSLNNNVLESCEGLAKLPCLHELHLNHNAIPSLEPLAPLHTLRKLVVRENLLTHLRGIDSLTMLSELDVSDNKILSLEELVYVRRLKMLKILNVHNNPMTNINCDRLHTLCILPRLVTLNEKDVDRKEKIHAANLHGEDYTANVEIRKRFFANGELDDGGAADPPFCVILPASDGKEGALADGVEAFVQEKATHDVATEGGVAALGAHIAKKYTSELDKVWACYTFLVKNGGTKPPLPAMTPILNAEHTVLETKLTSGLSGSWVERVAGVFNALLRVCGIEAHIAGGYYKCEDFKKGNSSYPAYPELICPNWAWVAVRINAKWRLIDIGNALINKSMDFFFIPPSEFIKSHLPLMRRWQLLDNMLELEDFWTESP
ncbi:hypothetical protein CYMTET_40093 [Cymbomonas tetramitiformis]|uniref:EF-hand domain-containing protein n=1 Tax=Cymbomonas tetramitiformis TaxID=36881 RepID=A0AAE0CA05_9CHLO|nr:hypothetical protein CYMTET_40093 [Cymbomonas tetramitiformis]|eukprot:gene6944-8284_t